MNNNYIQHIKKSIGIDANSEDGFYYFNSSINLNHSYEVSKVGSQISVNVIERFDVRKSRKLFDFDYNLIDENMISDAKLEWDRKYTSYSVHSIFVDGDMSEVIEKLRKDYPGIKDKELAKINENGEYHLTDYYFESDDSHDYNIIKASELYNMELTTKENGQQLTIDVKDVDMAAILGALECVEFLDYVNNFLTIEKNKLDDCGYYNTKETEEYFNIPHKKLIDGGNGKLALWYLILYYVRIGVEYQKERGIPANRLLLQK